jgi:dTMP kinase
MTDTAGRLVAFEGLDQSGKQTQAGRLADAWRAQGADVELLSFPDYASPIGIELGHALQGRRHFTPDVMQLLYIANRYEHRPAIEAALARGAAVVCDRYLASSIAYGEALGLDARWLDDLQRHLPQPALTVLLDIPPDVSLARKRKERDRYERDMALLDRVRGSYRRQAAAADWVVIDGTEPPDLVTGQVIEAVRRRLAPLSAP